MEVAEKKLGNPHIKIVSDIANFERQGRLIKTDREINPLDDEIFEYLAELAESHDGEHPAFSIKIRRYQVIENSKLDDTIKSASESKLIRVKVQNRESIDIDCVNRYKKRYWDKYPRTLAKL